MTPLQSLQQMALDNFRRRCPNVPEHAIPKFTYKDTTANGLTRMIIDYIRFSGGMAERVNSMGVYNPLKRQYRPSGSRKGTSDISAIYQGKTLKIEVKIGLDRLSEHQKRYAADVDAAGGLYFVARNFEEFYNWFNQKFERR